MFSPSFEEDEYFSQGTSSSLRNLFGANASTNSGNTDLVYVAPKQPSVQPKNADLLQQKKAQNSVLFAKVAIVFKAVSDNTYSIIGKYGLAIVGDSTRPKEIMLYKDKQNILTKATFKPNFQVQVENDYISFQDNENVNWHIQFEDDKNIIEFLEELRKGRVKIIEIEKKEAEKSPSPSITTTDSSFNYDSGDSMNTTRATILSRVAKMGQSILPGGLQRNQTDDSDNTSVSSYINSSNVDKETNILENPKLSSNIDSTKSDISLPPTFQANNNNFTQIAPYVMSYPGEHFRNPTLINTGAPSAEFNMFVSESRIQNSEIRMNLSSFNTKLDNVLQEINKLKEPVTTDRLETRFLKSKVKDLENTVTELSKQLIDADNSKECIELRFLVRDKDAQIKDHKEKVVELENLLKKSEENAEIVRDNLEKQAKELNEKLKNLELQLEDAQNNIKLNQSNIDELQKLNEDLLKRNKDLTEEIDELLIRTKSPINLDDRVKNFSDVIKESMNAMFQNIMSEVSKDTDNSETGEIKKILSSNIKHTTFDVIQKFKILLETSDPKKENDDRL